MNTCDYVRAQVSYYLDDELSGDDRRAVLGHLNDCSSCRAAFEAELRLLDDVRAAGPLYDTPIGLRERIEQATRNAGPPPATPPARRGRCSAFQRRPSIGSASEKTRLVAIAAAVLVFSAGGLIWFIKARTGRPQAGLPSELAMMAAATHLQHLRGQFPLEIASTSPEAVCAWFAGKIAFSLKLPNYQKASGQEELYRLEGGRRISIKNQCAAYISYQMGKHPISLIVTSDSVITPSGGEEIVSKGITFHYDAINSLKVITWSDQGLSYALVSNLEERGQQSCMVCHQGTKDKDFIQGLGVNQHGTQKTGGR